MIMGRPRNRSGRLGILVALGLAAAPLSACSPAVDVRGNVPDTDSVLAIQPGVQDKDQVAQLLGSPSSIGTFDDRKWYYISKRTETMAFFEPDVIDQQVVAIEFDDAGVVQTVELYGLEDGFEIEAVDRETPTFGTSLSVFQQLFGNIGRFVKGTDEQ